MTGTVTRVGLIGAGYWGTKLCEEYLLMEKTDPNFKLSYVADGSRVALDTLGQKLQVGRKITLTSDYKEIIDDKEVKGVHVAIPNRFHFEVAKKALEKGKNVLVEKPMALTSREAFKLLSLAREGGLVLQVGHIFRFNNSLIEMRNTLPKFGRLRYMRLSWATTFAASADRDIVFDLGPHPVDVLNFLLGEWPDVINATASLDSTGDSRASAVFVNLRFPDGPIATVYLSWVHYGQKVRALEVISDKARIDCDLLAQKVHVDYADGRSENLAVKPNNTIHDMEAHFVARIRARGPEFNDAFTGAMTVSVLESVAKSTQTGAMRAS